MSTDSNLPPGPPEVPGDGSMAGGAAGLAGRLSQLPIEEELKDSYLTYAMSVIVSRALPDVRDGLKPSQRRILVAMNDLNLNSAGRVSAKISGEERQLPPPRRERDLPHAGPHGPGMEPAARADRQAGELRFHRRPPARRDAIHRSPDVADRRLDARGHQAGHGRLRADLR